MEAARFASCAQESIYTGKYFGENRVDTNFDTLKSCCVQRIIYGWSGNLFKAFDYLKHFIIIIIIIIITKICKASLTRGSAAPYNTTSIEYTKQQ